MNQLKIGMKYPTLIHRPDLHVFVSRALLLRVSGV
jgi:hypothetical protein